MANVFVSSDYTITNVSTCNTASDAQVWYKVNFSQAAYIDSSMYVTPINDTKYPMGLAKADFLANVLPEMNTYISYLNTSTYIEKSDWETED